MTKYHMPIIIQKSCHIIMPEPKPYDQHKMTLHRIV